MKNKLYTGILVLILSLLSFAQETNAQAIPLLTDPIKVRELEHMSNELGMTSAQREAILEVYDRYLVDFARVRSNEIADFENGIAEAAQTFGFMQFNIPERQMVEGLIKQARRAMSAIHRSDTQFFDELVAMLTEKQLVILNRERIARELEAYNIFTTQLMGELNRGARTHMRELFSRLDVESSFELDELLDQYDTRYLNQVKLSFNAIIEAVSLTLDQIDELGLRDMDQQAMMMQFMMDETALDDLKVRGDLLLKPLLKQAYNLSQLNWSTWRKLNAILDEENARKLQGYYFKRSFTDAVRGGNKIEGYIDRALTMDEIEDWKKEELITLRETFRNKWKKRTSAHANLLEKSRQHQSIATLTEEVGTEFDERLVKFKQERQDYIEATESKINGILGKDLVARLKDTKKTKSMGTDFSNTTIVSSGDSSSGVHVAVTTSDGGELSQEELDALIESGEIQVVSNSSDGASFVVGEPIEISSEELSGTLEQTESTKLYEGATIPKPIAPSFSERAAVILELDESGAMIIGAVYDEYREKYSLANKDISKKSKAIQEDEELSTGKRRRTIREASAVAAEVVATLDQSFFADLAAITSLDPNDANLKMLEQHRERQRTAAPEDPFGWRGGEGDTIDLVGLYVMSDVSEDLQEGLTPESIQAIRNAMQGYHSKVSDSHIAFVKATTDLNHMQDAMWIMGENKPEGRGAQAMQKRWQTAFTSVRDTKRSLLLANQTVMDSLLAKVPETDFWKIRMEYVSKAYPDVFKKGSDLTIMLSAANAISELETAQASKLSAITDAYRSDYWALCESMITNHQLNATAKSGDGMMSKEDIHRQLRLETLRFERKELNDRLRMRLRMVLNDEQIKDVPGLRPSVAAVNEW
ncbi:MAG: hypothetical protein H8E86_06755 [Planctomycetes bacterium]|nr:hypothetical protein [Planctomycetota bacterium]